MNSDRQWLVDVLLSDSSESSDNEELTEEDLRQMLKEHLLKNRYRKKFYKNPKVSTFILYSSTFEVEHLTTKLHNYILIYHNFFHNIPYCCQQYMK